MRNTGKKLVHGAMTSTVALVLRMVSGLVLMPFVLRHLGDDDYGIWAFVAMFLGYYGVLDIGLTRAILRFVAGALGRGNREEADELLASGMAMFLVGAGVLIIASLAVGLSAHLWLAAESAWLVRWLVLILGISLAISFPARGLEGVLSAHVRQDLIGVADIIATVLRVASTFLILSVGGRLVALAAVAAASRLCRYALVSIMARYVHGPIRLDFTRKAWRRSKQLLGFGTISLISQIEDLLRAQSYPIIIKATLVSWGAITPYAIAFRLTHMLKIAGRAILRSTQPIFSRLEDQGDRLRGSFLFLYKLSCYLGIFMAGMIFVVSEPFILRWVGEGREISALLLRILIVGMGLAVAHMPVIDFLFGTSRHKYYILTNGFEAVLSFSGAIFLAFPFGLLGVAVGMAVPMALVKTFLQPIAACRAMKIPLRQFYLQHALPNILRPVLFIAALWLISPYVLQASYGRLALFGAAACVLYVPYICVVGFTAKERSQLAQAFRPSSRKKA